MRSKREIPAIRAIRDEAEHQAVHAEFRAFVDAHLDAADGTPAAAYIDAQGAILEAFEKRHWPVPAERGDDWDPIDLLIRESLRPRAPRRRAKVGAV